MLRAAILTLLAGGESSGYDLSKAFDRSVTYVWAASQSQIYPELRKLADKGLITGTDVPQDGRPDKRVYRLTDAGRDELIAWVAQEPSAYAVRDPFQLQMVNIGRLEPEQGAALVMAQRDLLRQRLDILTVIAEQLDAGGFGPGTPWSDGIGWRISVEAGIRTAAAYLEWCDWALEQVARAAAAPPTEAVGADR